MNGKRHDYGMFKEEFPPPSVVFPGDMALWMDLGFTGLVILYYPVTLMVSIFRALEGGNRALLVIHLVKIRY